LQSAWTSCFRTCRTSELSNHGHCRVRREENCINSQPSARNSILRSQTDRPLETIKVFRSSRHNLSVSITHISTKVALRLLSSATLIKGLPEKTVNHILPRDDYWVIKFQTYSDSGCSSSAYLGQHSPKAANVCHTFDSNEAVLSILVEATSCTRKCPFLFPDNVPSF
jgi:hypothetical protein